ncbi:F0F1 ATP synthase subunit B [Pectinatus brassicae]|uniref:ATP synthase subunit b n=1 Tax=Pectinatus brassicae TaxID=862415 RepID=A0A840UVU1_9FIRM|nr:F-type H+-transporting ATPase subunit b [Pectinatus brassicae]
MISLQLGTFMAQIVNFVILVILLKVFAYNPIMKILHERRAKIINSLQAAENDEKKAQQTLAEYQKQLADARITAQEIVDKATKRAQEEHDASIAQTKQEIEQMRKNAKEDIARERDHAAVQLKGEVVSLSILAASKIVAANMDNAANEKLVGEFIEKLDKDKLGGLSC